MGVYLKDLMQVISEDQWTLPLIDGAATLSEEWRSSAMWPGSYIRQLDLNSTVSQVHYLKGINVEASRSWKSHICWEIKGYIWTGVHMCDAVGASHQECRGNCHQERKREPGEERCADGEKQSHDPGNWRVAVCMRAESHVCMLEGQEEGCKCMFAPRIGCAQERSLHHKQKRSVWQIVQGSASPSVPSSYPSADHHVQSATSIRSFVAFKTPEGRFRNYPRTLLISPDMPVGGPCNVLGVMMCCVYKS